MVGARVCERRAEGVGTSNIYGFYGGKFSVLNGV